MPVLLWQPKPKAINIPIGKVSKKGMEFKSIKPLTFILKLMFPQVPADILRLKNLLWLLRFMIINLFWSTNTRLKSLHVWSVPRQAAGPSVQQSTLQCHHVSPRVLCNNLFLWSLFKALQWWRTTHVQQQPRPLSSIYAKWMCWFQTRQKSHTTVSQGTSPWSTICESPTKERLQMPRMWVSSSSIPSLYSATNY